MLTDGWADQRTDELMNGHKLELVRHTLTGRVGGLLQASMTKNKHTALT